AREPDGLGQGHRGAHGVVGCEDECRRAVRDRVGYLPGNTLAPPPEGAAGDPEDRREESLLTLIPDAAATPYDMQQVIRAVVDHGRWLELHAGYAQNILVGFARLGGRPVGVVADPPAVLAGVLDSHASGKAARFSPFRDALDVHPAPAGAVQRRIDAHPATFASPHKAAARGFVYDVIAPRDTRPRLIDALRMLRAKRDRNPPRKHGNIPL